MDASPPHSSANTSKSLALNKMMRSHMNSRQRSPTVDVSDDEEIDVVGDVENVLPISNIQSTSKMNQSSKSPTKKSSHQVHKHLTSLSSAKQTKEMQENLVPSRRHRHEMTKERKERRVSFNEDQDPTDSEDSEKTKKGQRVARRSSMQENLVPTRRHEHDMTQRKERRVSFKEDQDSTDSEDSQKTQKAKRAARRSSMQENLVPTRRHGHEMAKERKERRVSFKEDQDSTDSEDSQKTQKAKRAARRSSMQENLVPTRRHGHEMAKERKERKVSFKEGQDPTDSEDSEETQKERAAKRSSNRHQSKGFIEAKPMQHDEEFEKKDYEVRAIVDKKTGSDGNPRYLILWEGYDHTQCTWSNKEDLIGCQEEVNDFLIGSRCRNIIRERIKKENISHLFPFIEQRIDNLPGFHMENKDKPSPRWALKIWEAGISKMAKDIGHGPIFVDDWSTKRMIIPQFKFILKTEFTPKARRILKEKCDLHNDHFTVRCRCETNKCGGETIGCCTMNTTEDSNAYYENGLLKISKRWENPEDPITVMECSDSCSCSKDCPMRLTQRGRQIPLIIMQSGDRGWCVRTCRAIKKNSFISEYLGLVMTEEEATNSDCTYQFDMADLVRQDGGGLVLDAKQMGNESRFFNHSCSPNMVCARVHQTDHGGVYHSLCFFALRNIEVGEELTFDYFKKANPRGFTTCRCGAPNCIKTIAENEKAKKKSQGQKSQKRETSISSLDSRASTASKSKKLRKEASV